MPLRFEELDQSQAIGVGQRRMENQLCRSLLMVADQGPGVEAETSGRQCQVLDRDGGEAFEPRAEIVAKEAQDAADEATRAAATAVSPMRARNSGDTATLGASSIIFW